MVAKSYLLRTQQALPLGVLETVANPKRGSPASVPLTTITSPPLLAERA
jgi:hypothetical protein